MQWEEFPCFHGMCIYNKYIGVKPGSQQWTMEGWVFSRVGASLDCKNNDGTLAELSCIRKAWWAFCNEFLLHVFL